MAGTAVFGYAESDSEDELPAGWEERTTLDQRVYYVNHESRSTQWKHPRTGKRKRLVGEMPPHWERKELDNGKVVFVNHKECRTTYTDPRLAFAIEDTEGADARPRQKYDAGTKAMHILHGMDLTDTTVVITGANSGIGFETARCLAMHNAHVVMLCRNMESAEIARDKIVAQKSSAKIDILECDLSSLSSVRLCVRVFLTKGWPVHILILNAAVLPTQFSKTENGLEQAWAVNYLSHFYLTRLLSQKLCESAPGRIVVISSESHRYLLNPLTADDCILERFSPETPKDYWYIEQYSLSKLCNLLFAQALNRRLYNSRITVNAVHPGNMVCTGLSRHSYLLRLGFTVVRPFTKSLSQAASTVIFAAVATDLAAIGGQYLNNCWFCKPSPTAMDHVIQEKLWTLTDQIIDRFESGQLGPM